MVPYPVLALCSVILFASVHVWAGNIKKLGPLFCRRFLSIGGGVAISYVFIDLLPKLGKNDEVISEAFSEIFPFFERHAYIMALVGFLLFFTIERAHTFFSKKETFWMTFASYALFNFLVGYSVMDKEDPEIQPLALFSFAMALHYFGNDFSLTKAHGKEYQQCGKWLLAASLFVGWFVGFWVHLPAAGIAVVSAFIGGGVMMNVIRNELPQNRSNSLEAFLLAAFFYTLLLLSIGSKDQG